MLALVVLDFYIVRRREAYCDSYTVMLQGEERGIRLALTRFRGDNVVFTGERLTSHDEFSKAA